MFMEKSKDFDNGFKCGIIICLDYITQRDESVFFKEIVEISGTKRIIEEIKKNGLSDTKLLAKQEFPEYFK